MSIVNLSLSLHTFDRRNKYIRKKTKNSNQIILVDVQRLHENGK